VKVDCASRVRILAGALEIECEGSEEFVSEQVKRAMDRLLDHRETLESMAGPSANGQRSPSGQPEISLTPKSIAAKLAAKSGTDLIMVACAHLSLVQGRDTFSRAEIGAAMKEAAGFYKESFSSNLSNYLSTLLKEDKLREQSKDRYAIEARTRESLKARLI